MSLIADGVQTLNEDIEVIAFLPGSSYIFLLIAPGGNSELFFGLALVAAVVGAGFYNYLGYLKDEGREKREEKREEHKQNSPSEANEETTDSWEDPRSETSETDEENITAEDVIVIFLLVSWGVLLLISMYYLCQFFSKSWILPEVLFFVSFGVLAIYGTEGFLRLTIDDYGK